MSIETDFRSALASHAPLTALVGQRIALSAIPEGYGMPCVVYECTAQPIVDASGVTLDERGSLTVQCWAADPTTAAAVAQAATDAIAAAPAVHAAQVLERSTAYDPDIGADGVVVSFEWWQS